MKEEFTALLVQSKRSPNTALKVALHGAGIRTQHVRSCAEAQQVLAQSPQAHVIFADAALPDGTWADIVNLAENCSHPLNVVVVSPELDVDLYIRVLEGGGFDFVVPPFMGADLLHIANCTTWQGLTQERPPTSGRAAA